MDTRYDVIRNFAEEVCSMGTERDGVCVIMATYNGEKYLRSQVESILGGTYKNVVLRVFDDGSTDGTMELLEELSKEYPTQLFYKQNTGNLGCVKNFLQGAVETDSDYYMFSDQDDVWMEDKIERTLRQMKRAEHRGIAEDAEKQVAQNEQTAPDGQNVQTVPVAVFTDAIVVDESLKQLHPSFHRQSRLDMEKLDFPHLLMENKVIGCTLMFNRALQQKLTILPEEIKWHDWWVGLIASSMGVLSYLPEPTMYYRQHERNVIGNMGFGSYVGNRLKSLGRQRTSLRENCQQGQAFFGVYNDILSKETRKELYLFANLCKINFVRRRYVAFHHGFLKSGILRNAGIFFLL